MLLWLLRKLKDRDVEKFYQCLRDKGNAPERGMSTLFQTLLSSLLVSAVALCLQLPYAASVDPELLARAAFRLGAGIYHGPWSDHTLRATHAY